MQIAFNSSRWYFSSERALPKRIGRIASANGVNSVKRDSQKKRRMAWRRQRRRESERKPRDGESEHEASERRRNAEPCVLRCDCRQSSTASPSVHFSPRFSCELRTLLDNAAIATIFVYHHTRVTLEKPSVRPREKDGLVKHAEK